MKEQQIFCYSGKSNIGIKISYTIILLFIGCASIRSSDTNQIIFRTVGNIPVVEGKINGKKAFFILDTGASISLLNELEAGYFGFNFYSNSDKYIVGMGGRSSINKASNYLVELGTKKIRINFRTRNMNDFADIVKYHENIKIAGIIGSDVLESYNIKIDYGNKTICFY